MNTNKNLMETKYCEGCKEDKPIEEFSTSQKRRKCKKCLNKECREYKKKNRDKISVYNKQYKNDIKDEIKEYNHDYNLANREAIQKRQSAYQKERKKTDPVFKLAGCLRNRLRVCLKTRNRKSTKELTGCEYAFVRDWLQSQFIDDMTFENHGEKWHIDHVLPCAKFNMLDEEEQRRCFNWTNLQPMFADDNLTKNDRVSMKEVNIHIKKVKKYMKENDLEETEYTIGTYDITQYTTN